MSHRFIGDSFSVPLIPETKLFLHVLIDLSTTFFLCISGGANWYSILLFLSNYFNDSQASLSINNVFG